MKSTKVYEYKVQKLFLVLGKSQILEKPTDFYKKLTFYSCKGIGYKPCSKCNNQGYTFCVECYGNGLCCTNNVSFVLLLLNIMFKNCLTVIYYTWNLLKIRTALFLKLPLIHISKNVLYL